MAPEGGRGCQSSRFGAEEEKASRIGLQSPLVACARSSSPRSSSCPESRRQGPALTSETNISSISASVGAFSRTFGLWR